MKNYIPYFFRFFIFSFYGLVVFGFFSIPVASAASYQKIAPGETVTIGEFVFDDNFVATTTDCTVGITDPLNVEVVPSTTLMTANNDGWHYYDYTTALNAPTGTWPSIIICGSVARGDLVIVDKSFIVETSVVKEIRDSQLAGWTVSLSDFGQILASGIYRAKVTVLNFESVPTDSFAVPTVTIYDADRNIVVQDVAMTKLSSGVYEFTHTLSSSAGAGAWETVVNTEVESGKTIQTNDYFEVEASPARVTINSITDNIIPDITTEFAIANEGTIGYEYQYEYCVVSTIENVCGGGDDIAYAMAAEFIEAGVEEQFSKTLTVNNAGTYFWKVAVYWGTEKSVAVLQFNAVSDEEPAPPPSGGGGGGGGGGGTASATTGTSVYNSADFNTDGFVNSVDFSILLFYWKTSPPFANPSVDINKDGKVDLVDFSILLFQWGQTTS